MEPDHTRLHAAFVTWKNILGAGVWVSFWRDIGLLQYLQKYSISIGNAKDQALLPSEQTGV